MAEVPLMQKVLQQLGSGRVSCALAFYLRNFTRMLAVPKTVERWSLTVLMAQQAG